MEILTVRRPPSTETAAFRSRSRVGEQAGRETHASIVYGGTVCRYNSTTPTAETLSVEQITYGWLGGGW